jgi:hypothetical protein
VHEGSRHIIFATDPLNDFTVAFAVVKRCDQETMDGFLDRLKGQGLDPLVVITDGSPLYKQALVERWEQVEPQLCLCHVIRDALKEVLAAVRAVRDRLPPPRRYRRLRPGKRGRKRKKDERRAFITKHQYLIVKRAEKMSPEESADLERLLAIDPQVGMLREFVERFLGLMDKRLTPRQARGRRTRLVHNPLYENHPQLKKVLKMVRREQFEKMIVHLSWKNVDSTNNHVERNNRSFRMMQKTRYKRRRTHTIEKALWLDIERRWRRHPLFKEPENRVPSARALAFTPPAGGCLKC